MGMRTFRVAYGFALVAAGTAGGWAWAADTRKPALANPVQVAIPAPIPANAAAKTMAAPQPAPAQAAKAPDPDESEAPLAPASKAEAKPKAPDTWSPAEIADATARCAVILKRIQAVAMPLAPIREGSCGTPAPIQLISIGKNPEVAVSPPATITCDLAEGLATWLKSNLQPLAKQHLGSEIIRIETMSDYSCRAAYGRSGHKLSEHGHANALDIRGFVTASAKTAYVLEGWGKPEREVREEIAAAKAAAERAAAVKLAAEKAAEAARLAAAARQPGKGQVAGKVLPAPAAIAVAPNTATTAISKSTVVDGTSKLSITLPSGQQAHDGASSLSLAADKLGGPKAQPPAAGPAKVKISEAERMSLFLHAAHTSACRIFGTTLGPEANGAHRNHFHVDMAERKTSKFCE